MQFIVGHAQAVPDQVIPDNEPDASHDDEPQDSQADDSILGKGHQRNVGFKAAHQVKSRIAKRRDGVKNPEIHAFGRPHEGNEPQGEQKSSQQFKQYRDEQHTLDQPDSPTNLGGADGFHEQAALLDADFLSHDNQEEDRYRHEAQAANLDERKDDQLPEPGELGEGIKDNQARDAGCAGRGEERFGKAKRLAAAVGQGQHQKHSPQDDNHQKAQCNALLQAQPYPFENQHPGSSCLFISDREGCSSSIIRSTVNSDLSRHFAPASR